MNQPIAVSASEQSLLAAYVFFRKHLMSLGAIPDSENGTNAPTEWHRITVFIPSLTPSSTPEEKFVYATLPPTSDGITVTGPLEIAALVCRVGQHYSTWVSDLSITPIQLTE